MLSIMFDTSWKTMTTSKEIVAAENSLWANSRRASAFFMSETSTDKRHDGGYRSGLIESVLVMLQSRPREGGSTCAALHGIEV
jgi:hypothetical protein